LFLDDLDVLVQSKRNKAAALKLVRKLLKRYTVVPVRLVTDDLRHAVQRPAIWGLKVAMSAGDGKTIGQRIRISQARCNDSRALAQPRYSSQLMPPYSKPSTSNAI
jgi:hypothetical protein